MDYKEKLKEALNSDNTDYEVVRWIEQNFPELKESEVLKIKSDIQYAVRCAYGDNSSKTENILAWLDEQKPADKVESFDKYKGLTDFERTLADICIGWIGEEYGWKQYIKDNADVLLKIAIEMFNSIQDAPFEQKSAAWSDEDEKMYKIAFSCIETLEDISNGKNMHADVKEWLKSLKNRIGG